jgi:cytochrome b561
MPHNDTLHAILRSAHAWLAYLFFAAILLHVAAALFHALVRHDGVFQSMASWRAGSVGKLANRGDRISA